MSTYTVRVLGAVGFVDGPQNLTFHIDAVNYGEAVIAVGTYLAIEKIPYRAFAGSQDLGR